LVLAVAALVVPTLFTLAREPWSTSNGAHGPLILVSGLWLLMREHRRVQFRGFTSSAWWLVALLPWSLLYIYGRTFGMLGAESLALYAILVLLGIFYFGAASVGRLWFPLLYLAFLIRPPEGLTVALTQPLQIAISQGSVTLLHAFGYPVGQSGVLIQIAQYELLVKQACAGLGSLITLFAMGLLYVHLAKPPSRSQQLWLLAGLLPIAVAANFVRVVALVLLTYHFGDSVAQGFLHETAGVVTFFLSMLGLLAFDALLQLRANRR
jgi:exosortase